MGVTHEPPHTLVMKKGGWRIAEESCVVLINKDGEEEARRVSGKERRVIGAKRTGSILYGQAGDPDGKNCAMM